MKKVSLIIASAMVIFATSCKENKKEAENDMDNSEMTEETMEEEEMDEMEDAEMKKAMASLQAESDSNLSGKVMFTEENGEVTMKAEIMGLSEGEHAIHIHEKGDCSSADGKSAGGHWNPTDQPHGKWGSEEGYHKGDIGNFKTNADGLGTISITTNEWCIGCDDDTKNIVDKAIIVHDGQDDFTSQPSGAAGTRMGCGVIEMQ
ncbi:superoxide dismutase family protein [Mesonia sp.]|uniref:superoxide dismutase family protein n=1 Tax=Mesonia sp. TaxID=1960830 RepID=UPI001768BA7D|nr:superoxide dismutase family protein [Mesonia sp.]HIB37875.1 superoxide dismutase family protein [Mesonia sp.]HIO27844.1 superoxide dismutase family protein [Flavobacteriaceae bacterium]